MKDNSRQQKPARRFGNLRAGETITSRANPRVKQMRALRQRKARDADGLYLVEGIRHVGEAVEAHAPIECICYAPDRLTSDFARDLIRQQSARGVPCYESTADIFDSLSEKENPQGILAVVRQQRTALADLSPQNFAWGVALVAPQDAGNVGSILRTIDAVGASGLLLIDSSVDPYHPSSVRASMGAIFWYPIVTASFAEFVRWAKPHAYRIVGTSARGKVDYREADYARPLIVLMGSEREGLSQEQVSTCDQLVRIPMRGRVSSLNLSVATGIMLHEVKRTE